MDTSEYKIRYFKLIVHIILRKVKKSELKKALELFEIYEKFVNKQPITLGDLKYLTIKNIKRSIEIGKEYVVDFDLIDEKLIVRNLLRLMRQIMKDDSGLFSSRINSAGSRLNIEQVLETLGWWKKK